MSRSRRRDPDWADRAAHGLVGTDVPLVLGALYLAWAACRGAYRRLRYGPEVNKRVLEGLGAAEAAEPSSHVRVVRERLSAPTDTGDATEGS